MNTKILSTALVILALTACGKKDAASTDQANVESVTPAGAKASEKPGDSLPGGIRPSFPFTVTPTQTVKNANGSVNYIKRVSFRQVESSQAAAELRSRYRKLGYSVANSKSDAGRETYVARKAGKRIRYVVVAVNGQADSTGMVTFYWQQ